MPFCKTRSGASGSLVRLSRLGVGRRGPLRSIGQSPMRRTADIDLPPCHLSGPSRRLLSTRRISPTSNVTSVASGSTSGARSCQPFSRTRAVERNWKGNWRVPGPITSGTRSTGLRTRKYRLAYKLDESDQDHPKIVVLCIGLKDGFYKTLAERLRSIGGDEGGKAEANTPRE